VEEPIEVIQQSKKCQVTQRGVGPHTQTFKSALKGALRQDPDIIVIGEMRDLETIEMAISASETGHLVIGTMHTSDAATTLNRLLDVFPPAQQPQIRAMVSESLRGIICQRLLPNQVGGLSLAGELLLQNLAVSALIREGKTQALSNVMETGRRAGMIQMDQSVLELWENGYISDDIAVENIRNRMLHQKIHNYSEADAPAS
jgi:twitching motility protein PilT